MNVKWKFIIFLLLIIKISESQQYWVRVMSPTTKFFRSCTFTDTLNGWACGDSGVIIHTSNGGMNWYLQQSPIDYQISYITFIDKNHGWAIANNYLFQGTAILKTVNGGVSWTYSLYPDTSKILKTIYFLDTLNGYLGGQYGTILRTTNGGMNWGNNPIDSGQYSDRMIYKFSFMNTQRGFACGGTFDAGGVIWKTTDFGIHWSNRLVAPEPIFDMSILDTQTIVASGGDYEFGAEIVKTQNKGDTWNYQSLQMFGIGYSIASRTKYDLWVALGYGANWERSLDNGNTFNPIPIPDTSGIYDVKFVDSLHGWAVGANSSIYKFNTNVIGIKPVSRIVPAEYKLEQNYPNPFNPRTKIKFQAPLSPPNGGTQIISIVIYDVRGRKIATVFSSPWGRTGGATYEIEFDGSNYASGVYFYQLRITNYELGIDWKETKRMVILK